MENLLTPFFQHPANQASALGCLRILGYRELLKEYEMQINLMHFQLIHSSFEEAKLLIHSYYGTEYLQKCGYDFTNALQKIQVGSCVFIHLPTRFDTEGQSWASLLLCHFLRCYQFLLLLRGYYIRGIIDFGPLAPQPNSFITSQLEFLLDQEKAARFPRVIISPKALAQIIRQQNWGPSTEPYMLVQAQEDEKIFFINPLYYQDFWEQAKQKLNQNLNNMYLKPSDPAIPFVDLWNAGIQATQKFFEMTKGLTENYLEINQKNINTYLKTIVGNQMLKHSFSPQIRDKYEWLFNFILWCNKERSAHSSSFCYFSPCLQHS
jgi:hypothetical protein